VERGLEEDPARAEEAATAEPVLAERVLPAGDCDAADDTELLPDAGPDADPDTEMLTDAAREAEFETVAATEAGREAEGAPEVAAREAENEPEPEMEMEFDVEALQKYTTILLLEASPTKVREP